MEGRVHLFRCSQIYEHKLRAVAAASRGKEDAASQLWEQGEVDIIENKSDQFFPSRTARNHYCIMY